MKQRLISAFLAFIIFIPIFIKGGSIFNLVFYLLTIIGIREFMKVREKEKPFPDFIRLITYLVISMLYFQNILDNKFSLALDYRLIAGIFLTLLLPVVLYKGDKVYNIKDAFYLIGGVFFLGFSMTLFSVYRNISLKLIIFLFLITIITDSYALFIGKLIGKNKLLEEISPNKTWEGTIGGSLIATFTCTVYYITVIDPNISLGVIVSLVFFLSLIGQFGDLLFSAIKRTYGVKDFSNIMPGHGGVLDRLDSTIFVMLAFTFFLELI